MAQNNVRTGQPEDFMRIQDLFYLCLSKWYWFVISLGITLSVAILYVLVTPPVYMRSAALLIKDESKGQSLSGEVGGSFSDLGLFQANTNVNNELISLQSPAIMLDVVNRLRLDVAYHTDGAFYRKVLYGQDLPVSVSFADLQDNESVSFTLRLLDEENVELSDFIRDQMTLLDAISMAGDLTIYGKRDKVMVLREENGAQRVYGIDLCSASQMYASPAYNLQQNDVIYVEPNTVRARQSTVNGNNVRSTSFWISLASLLTTISVLVFK